MKAITFDIREMIKLRSEGWGYSALARRYKKDHSTIIYHCQRLNVKQNELLPEDLAKKEFLIELADTTSGRAVKERKIKSLVLPKYAYLMDEPVNRGKTYKEYLAEALKRPIEKRYHDIYYRNFGVTRLAQHQEEERSEDYFPDSGMDEGQLPGKLCV